MKYIKNICPLCESKKITLKHSSVRDNDKIKVLFCNNCTLVFLSDFSLGNEESNRKSSMHNFKKPNFNNWLKETYNDDLRRFKFLKKKIINKNVLDFGCGNGGFIRLALKSAKNIHGYEIDESLLPHLKKKGLQIFNYFDQIDRKYSLITAFHVLEHLDNPLKFLKALSKLLSSNGEIVIEIPNSSDALVELYSCEAFKNFTYWSQHLMLYNEGTIKRLIKKLNMKLNWIQHIQRYPVQNHIHWIQSGKPGGHNLLNSNISIKLEKSYEFFLKEIKMTDTIIFGISN